MKEKRNACEVLVGKLEVNKLHGRPQVDGMVILKRIFKEIG
jgi:hypothetical protein